MILVSMAQVTTSAMILVLAGGCARNMLQTVRITNAHSTAIATATATATTTATTTATSAATTTAITNGIVADLLPSSAYESTDAMVDHLQSLSRSELLQLFCYCAPPKDLSTLQGDWNGVLLNNNNLGMTSVGSKFMSNTLFGKGRRWNGKTFGPSKKGCNRFDGTQNGLVVVEKEHSFDYAVEESRVQRGTPSVRVLYSSYQSLLSPWRTMADEVRCLPGGDVLIGCGAMAWSGGMMNSAPFCLYRAGKKLQ